MYSIGIDVGTTNCKVCVYRLPDFALVDKQSFPTPKIETEYGADFDIHALWQGVVASLAAVAAAVDAPQEIASIAVASVGEAGVLLDAEDQIIGPVMTWYDSRTQPQHEAVVNRLGEANLYEVAGIPAHSNYSLNKILWLLAHTQTTSAASWLCLAEYLAFRLSGVKRAEYSLASRTLAFDMQAGEWSETICHALSLPVGLFSPLVNAGEPIGTLLAGLAEQTGIPATAKIAIAGHDHMCGSVAAGIRDEGQILNSTGTTEGLLVVRGQPATTPDYFRARVSNGRHVLPGAYTLYASLPSAGYAIEWFRTLFGLSAAEFSAMTQRLVQAGAAERPQEHFLIPHLRGSGPPKRSIFARGMIYGIDEHSGPEALLSALFHGLCFELKLLLETYESLTGHHWPAIMVIGAACQNPYWLQLKANILNREIVACSLPEAVSLGAAIIGARGAGLWAGEHHLPEGALIRYRPDSSTPRFQAIYTRLYLPLYDAKTHIETPTGQDDESQCLLP